jgi:hypothetical protein
MNQSLEDAMIKAKASASSSTTKNGIGVARHENYAIIAIDFSKPAAQTLGAKATGLLIQPGYLVNGGSYRAATAIVGQFNLQLAAAGDLLGNQSNPAVGARANLAQVANNTANAIELLINVVAAASTGIATFIVQIYPA